MSDGHSGPDDTEDEGHMAPDETNAQEPAAEKTAAEEPVAEEAAPEQAAVEKPAPKKRAPRKPAAPKAPGEKPAPKKAVQKPVEPPPPPPAEEPERGGIFAALREPVVMWSVIAGVVVILAALGYVGWMKFGHKHAEGSANALAERSICEATLDRVQDYGVLPPGATLAQADPDKTQINGRVTCHAQAGDAKYALTVDVPCDDMGKDACLKLYSVKQSDGTALFQRQM